jgi:hypothetical protein
MTYLSKSAVLIALLSPFGMANTLLDDLSICAKNSDNLQRLVCYDKLAENSPSNQQKVQQQIPLQVTSSIPLTQQNQNNLVLTQLKPPQKAHIIKPQSAFNVTNEVNQQQSSFGQEDKQRTKNLIKEIQAQVVLVKKGTHSKQIITLNNGQVWRQTDSTYLKLRKGQAIIIKRGAMGSFFIGKHSTNKRIRAKRIK